MTPPGTRSRGAANAIFFNHGQRLRGRLLGSTSRRAGLKYEVIEGVSEIAKSIKLGPGMSADTQMGPLVSDEQLSRVTGYLESGRADGATAVTGGGRWGDRGYFVEPTVITGTRPDMKIVREEIFGPEPLWRRRSSRSMTSPPPPTTPSTASARASGPRTSPRCTPWRRSWRACMVWINCYNVFDASLPFGGYKQSGPGCEEDGPRGPRGLHRGQARR